METSSSDHLSGLMDGLLIEAVTYSTSEILALLFINWPEPEVSGAVHALCNCDPVCQRAQAASNLAMPGAVGYEIDASKVG